MLEQQKPLVVDAMPLSKSIQGAVGLMGEGIGGNVPVGWNAERYQGRNLALRLVALGYPNVYWYRGGREAWKVAGLPETAVNMQDW